MHGPHFVTSWYTLMWHVSNSRLLQTVNFISMINFVIFVKDHWIETQWRIQRGFHGFHWTPLFKFWSLYQLHSWETSFGFQSSNYNAMNMIIFTMLRLSLFFALILLPFLFPLLFFSFPSLIYIYCHRIWTKGRVLIFMTAWWTACKPTDQI